MNKFWATFSLTYLNKIKSKGFIIFMSIVVVLMVALSNVDKIIDFFDDGPDKIGVATPNEQLYKAFKSQSNAIDNEAKFVKVSEQDATARVKQDKLDKAYLIKENKNHTLNATIISKKRIGDSDQQKLTAVLSSIQTHLIAADLNISQQDLQKLQSKSKVDNEVVSKDEVDKVSEGQKAFNYILAYVTIFLMFFIIFNFASQLAMEIASEKTSRVIEMIITSISPIKHILAKILAIVAVAFTQIILICTIAVLCIFTFDLKDLLKGFNVEMNELSWQIISVGIISVILGILTYVLLAAILGSLTARIEDLNQSLMPLTLIAMVAFYIALFTINNPDMKLATVTSFIPFLAPFQLVVRAQTSSLQIWEIVVSSGISIVVIVVLMWIAIKTYKDSVLTFEKGIIKSLKRVFKK